MNILVINGSPKGERSNSLRLTRAFVEGFCKAGRDAPQVETLDLTKLRIEGCLGCFACWSKTPGKCCIRDDMAEVIDRLRAADVIIWSFPLYYFSVPSKMKALIDRQLPMLLPLMDAKAESGGHPARYDMRGKRTVLISTCGFYTAEGNYDGVTAMFDHICGKGGYTAIFCGQGELFRVPQLAIRTNAYLMDVRRAGEEFARGGVTEATQKKLRRLLFPRKIFEKMANASW